MQREISIGDTYAQRNAYEYNLEGFRPDLNY
jgi:hypothetical protein